MPAMAPPTDKQLAIDALDRLPASVTLDEISEELAILAALRRAEADVAAGRFVTHDEIERRSASWITK